MLQNGKRLCMSKKSGGRKVPEWAKGDALMEWYATTIWGQKIDDDDTLFEIMSLELFQAGLNWKMILKRRDAFRKVFKDWNIGAVASFGVAKVNQIILDASIIRNRRKIEACIANAKVIQDIQKEHGSFCHWFYEELAGDDLGELQKTLRKTFKFIGPEIARMWLMASGRISSEEID